eukprot:1161671-Pelagomonas_calceolata.AAC.7
MQRHWAHDRAQVACACTNTASTALLCCTERKHALPLLLTASPFVLPAMPYLLGALVPSKVHQASLSTPKRNLKCG